MKERHKPIRIVIYVSGGVVQDVLAEDEAVEAMIVDYDNEASSAEFVGEVRFW